RPGEKKCMARMHQTVNVDWRVWKSVCGMLEHPERIKAMARLQSESAEDASTWMKDLRDAEAKLTEHQRRCAYIDTQSRRGRFDQDRYARHLTEAERERKTLQRQVDMSKRGAAQADQQRSGISAVLEHVAALRKRLRDASAAVRREVVEAVVRRVVVSSD